MEDAASLLSDPDGFQMVPVVAEPGGSAGPEDPQEVHLVAAVDLEDPDEVLDVVMERMLQFQLDEELPVYVSLRRTPQRCAALRAAQRQRTALLPPSGAL